MRMAWRRGIARNTVTYFFFHMLIERTLVIWCTVGDNFAPSVKINIVAVKIIYSVNAIIATKDINVPVMYH